MEKCPLCRDRAPRRFCPGTGRNICPVCCGTKREVEISCPAGCPYLATARAHPPAVVRRQEERDSAVVRPLLDGLTERQLRLSFLLLSPALHFNDPLLPLSDLDLMEAAGALAATYQTAASGVIYDHRPASLAAQRLCAEMKDLLGKAGIESSREMERDSVQVLRRIERAAAEAGREARGGTALLEALGRVARAAGEAAKAEAGSGRLDIPGSSLILAP